MKKTYLTLGVAAALAGSMLFTSCIGSFSLTNKLLNWNHQISNKFVNELVFLAFWIVPVYEVSALADLLVVNSIEFWSGRSPMAQGKSVIEGQDGKYLVDCDGKGYTITSENDGTSIRLDFDEAEQSWTLNTPEGKSVKFMTFVDPEHVKMITPSGDYQLIELSQAGLMAYRQTVAPALMAAR